jgi:hypothetical protein
LIASSRNLSSVGSRHAATCSTIVTNSALQTIRLTSSSQAGGNFAAKYGRYDTSIA